MWKNDKPLCFQPGLIAVVDAKKRTVCEPPAKVGNEVSVIGLNEPRIPHGKGIAILGPRF